MEKCIPGSPYSIIPEMLPLKNFKYNYIKRKAQILSVQLVNFYISHHPNQATELFQYYGALSHP